jgi:histidine triad (HIT) family protein
MLKDDCLFCKIIKGEIPCNKVYEDENVFAFKDINPQAPVHILIIPKIHIEKVADLDNSNKECVSNLVMIANKLADELGITEAGYRLVVNCNKDAGQDVFHLHVHLLGGRKFNWPPG